MAKCIEIKPRYIDANEINWQKVEYEYGKRNNTIIACEIAVDETPEVDVAPVIHAHWNEFSDYTGTCYAECSHCGLLWWIEEGTAEENEMYYCPKCGAKMDGEIRNDR